MKTYSVILFSASNMGPVATRIETFGQTDDEKARKAWTQFLPPVGKELYLFGGQPKAFLFEVTFENNIPQFRLVASD